jgi:hypothetical protein
VAIAKLCRYVAIVGPATPSPTLPSFSSPRQRACDILGSARELQAPSSACVLAGRRDTGEYSVYAGGSGARPDPTTRHRPHSSRRRSRAVAALVSARLMPRIRARQPLGSVRSWVLRSAALLSSPWLCLCYFYNMGYSLPRASFRGVSEASHVIMMFLESLVNV